MTAGLPPDVQRVFERFLTTEYVTIDAQGRPIVWPVTPYYTARGNTIDVTTGLGYPKKADDAARNPHVALLFSDPTGSAIHDAPTVLVQGTAHVDDRDLEANRLRYERESQAKLPGLRAALPPQPLRRLFSWYFTRIYIHVTPERIYVWPPGDPEAEPTLYDAHMEEVRSHHNEEPEEAVHPPAPPGPTVWHDRLDQLGRDPYRTAVLAVVGPDGFPFAVRVRVHPDRAAGLIRMEDDPLGAPLEPGEACLVAHAHDERFTWERNFQVRGELAEQDGRWVLRPQRLVAGFELPPGSTLGRVRLNAGKALRFTRTAHRRRTGTPV